MKEGRFSVRRKTFLALLVIGSGITGIVGGAVGGAAGAYWVLETMARPEFKPKVKNAVISYDMPKQGARPIDIMGINKIGTPLHPCLVSFLKDQEELPNADWKKVRLQPYFKVDGDIITEMAFAEGYFAITRENEITVRVLGAKENRKPMSELLMFHELVHVDQYASGRMDLPKYAASAAQAMAEKNKSHDNSYEDEARSLAKLLLKRWITSEQRADCHPDLTSDDVGNGFRASSEMPVVQYAIYDRKTSQYQAIEYRYENKRL